MYAYQIDFIIYLFICSACIAAIWFVIERFGKQIFFCAQYLHAGLGTRRQERPGTVGLGTRRQERPGTRRSTVVQTL